MVVTWAGGDDVTLSKEDHLEIAYSCCYASADQIISISPNQFPRPGRAGRRRHTTAAGGCRHFKEAIAEDSADGYLLLEFTQEPCFWVVILSPSDGLGCCHITSNLRGARPRNH
jgi:hypothetical protein